MVRNLPCNARDRGSIPGQGTKILHAVEQLNLRATSRKPVHCNQRSRVTKQKSCVLQLRPDAETRQINKYFETTAMLGSPLKPLLNTKKHICRIKFQKSEQE